jgi:acetyl esterase/lipase
LASEIALWDGPAPGSEDWTHDEIGPVPFAPDVEIVRNVRVPTLTKVSDGATAVIVAPGGAYHLLALEHEGFAVARWLAERGYGTYVLKYRLQPTPAEDGAFREVLAALFSAPDDPDRWRADLGPLLTDGPQAVRRVRELGHERVVMVGFSAGALLTVRTLQSDSPPDAAALIYPPHIDDVAAAPPDAPPIFVAMASDDPLTTRGATALHEHWRVAKRPCELHLFERGGHGFGMNEQGLPADAWIALLGAWLASHPEL